MPLVANQGAPATCGHPQSGSSKVFVDGKGACRVEVDTAGGLIIGPGSQNVFIEGKKASLIGDVISSHGKPPHTVAFTTATQSKVFIGTGFAGDVDPDTGESISTGNAPKPDLVLELFTTNYGDAPVVYASGTGIYPPTNMTQAYLTCNTGNLPPGWQPPSPPPNIVYSYRIKNVGQDPSQDFTVGLWRFLNTAEAPDEAILTVQAAELYPDAQLVATKDLPGLAPGGVAEGTLVFPETYSVGQYVFGLYPDVYQTVTEPNEQNSAPTIRVVVSNSCG